VGEARGPESRFSPQGFVASSTAGLASCASFVHGSLVIPTGKALELVVDDRQVIPTQLRRTTRENSS